MERITLAQALAVNRIYDFVEQAERDAVRNADVLCEHHNNRLARRTAATLAARLAAADIGLVQFDVTGQQSLKALSLQRQARIC